jgi:hypothetical protein
MASCIQRWKCMDASSCTCYCHLPCSMKSRLLV